MMKKSQDICKLPSLNFYKGDLIFMGDQIQDRPLAIDFFKILKRKVQKEDDFYKNEIITVLMKIMINQIQDDSEEDDFQSLEDRTTFQTKLHDEFFISTQVCSTIDFHFLQTCYIFAIYFILSILNLLKDFFDCQFSIMNLQKNKILQINEVYNNQFVVRNLINLKILRIQECNSLIIKQLKIIPIKMALQCFNLDGFIKLILQQLFYNSITPCSRNLCFGGPYVYGSINHQDIIKSKKH